MNNKLKRFRVKTVDVCLGGWVRKVKMVITKLCFCVCVRLRRGIESIKAPHLQPLTVVNRNSYFNKQARKQLLLLTMLISDYAYT